MTRSRAVGLLLLVTLGSQGCIERWVYLDLVSAPPGARVRSKGLDAPHAVRDRRAPTGHFLRCTVDAVTPALQIPTESWSYVFALPDHSEEEVFVERAEVAKACADSQRHAREKPHLVRALLVASSTEKGLTNSVLITSNPPGATVKDDRTDAVLGQTPLRRVYVFYAPYAQVHPIRLELAGYVTLRREVTVRSIGLHANLYRPGETAPSQNPPVSKAAPAQPDPERVPARASPGAGSPEARARGRRALRRSRSRSRSRSRPRPRPQPRHRPQPRSGPRAKPSEAKQGAPASPVAQPVIRPHDLEGRIALVPGASRGIGEAIGGPWASCFLRDGRTCARS